LLAAGLINRPYFSGESIVGFANRDAQLKGVLPLPTGASAVRGAAINLNTGSRDQFLAECEILITAPALVVGQLANASIMTYDLTMSVNADGSSPTVIYPGIIVQTGAGGVGAAAATKRARLPLDVAGYVCLQVTNSAAANASAASATLEIML
jgi:hypothetical protein